MKPAKFSLTLHSLQDLKVIQGNRSFLLPSCPPVSTNNKTENHQNPENEQRLFQEAMADAGVWRKWILAFTSARLCDGGTGATYVLLRERPYTKRYGKTRND